ncbi:MAG: penicillin-binding protein 2 [Acidobacteriota bacterium]|jgi:penicillin-binding protein 2|nr:penicillin-binding protein 2 [Acidobacteriota bacterium]
MYIDQRQLSGADMDRISRIATAGLVVVFSGLLFIFWNVQVVRHEHYNDLARQNIYRRIQTPAPRGLIHDRRGRVLAGNRLNFNLFLVRKNTRNLEASIRFAAQVIGVPAETIRKRLDQYRDYPAAFPVPIRRNLNLRQVVVMQSRSDTLPEFELSVEPGRNYPLGRTAAHVLGYVSEISETELSERAQQGYLQGDAVGKSGVEKEYEALLKGTKGMRLVIRDNLGIIRRLVDEVEPVPGDNISLTLDLPLQQFAENEFRDQTGILAVADLETGGILALVSRPAFDPGAFSGILEPETWQSLLNHPSRPLQDRFIRGRYSPGSVFKLVMTLAGLEEGLITSQTTVTCTGAVRLYNRDFHCWNSWGHGRVNLSEALRDSCNIYFYLLGRRLDIDIIAGYAKAMGLGEKTGIDLPGEVSGIMPTRSWKQKRFQSPWYPGETISVSIGGGWVTVTPAQVLQMISTIALRGRCPQLHLLRRIERRGEELYRYEPRFRRLPIRPEHFEKVIEGMFRSVNDEGTGKAARVPGLEICGKTGTQQVISKDNPRYRELAQQKRFRPHSWFASFAPRTNPRYAVVVLVEHGGDAGEIAAPLAARVYRRLFANE